MAKAFIPSVLTANHLLEGDAVWWTGKEWSRNIENAEVIATAEDATTILEMASTSAVFEAEVVGPYLVEIDTATIAPATTRLHRAPPTRATPATARWHDATRSDHPRANAHTAGRAAASAAAAAGC